MKRKGFLSIQIQKADIEKVTIGNDENQQIDISMRTR